MNKVTALITGFALLGTSLVFAQQSTQTQPATAQAQRAKLVEVNNKFCPVSGEKVAGSGEKVGTMGPPVKYIYDGKVYRLCCPMCIKDFKNNPKKYSKIAEEDAAKNGTLHSSFAP